MYIITYDIWIFTFVCLCTDNSYPNWLVYVELYYLQLFTIIAYHYSAHIMLLPYDICHMSYDIWHMGSQNYELMYETNDHLSAGAWWVKKGNKSEIEMTNGFSSSSSSENCRGHQKELWFFFLLSQFILLVWTNLDVPGSLTWMHILLKLILFHKPLNP